MGYEERDMDAYYEQRADEEIWRRAKALGVSRRRFMHLAGLAGGGVLLGAACTDKKKDPALTKTTSTSAPKIDSNIVKDIVPSKFNYTEALGFTAEMKWENMATRGYLTPNDLFYVRQADPTPRINELNWKLTVSGSGVTTPVEFTYDQLLAMPEVTSAIRYIESSANGRVFFDEVLGEIAYQDGEKGKVALPQTRLGTVGVAEWTGVPLGALLDRAGVKPSARDVVPGGLDVSKLRRPMSIAKAKEGDTLLAFAMNGSPLPLDHGFPLRAIVPGWVGNHSVKWLGSIEVSEEAVFVPQNTTLDVYIGPDYKPEPPRLGPVVEKQVMKTALELEWPGKLKPGARTIRGRAWGPEGIRKVEYSVDEGKTWSPAQILPGPNEKLAWVRFSFNWDATAGEHKIMTRATDLKNQVQPDKIPWNQHGLTYGAVVAHPVTVA
jgi:DMSO/TMAO reductase YedYZ molybdopterin-dependent catalytic subunit